MHKEAGGNAVRLHAEPYPEYYIEAADEIGILIIDETAMPGSDHSMDEGNPHDIETCRRWQPRPRYDRYRPNCGRRKRLVDAPTLSY